MRLSLLATLAYGLVACGLCLLAPTALIAVLSKEGAVVAEGRTALRLLSLAYPVSGVWILSAAYFQSTGEAREALALTLGGILLVKLPVLFLASALFAVKGIWASEAASELLLASVSLVMLWRRGTRCP